MPWTTRGQYCMYCTHYLLMGNMSRHLDTYVSFEGRFSTDKAKEALVLEQKNKASYFRKYALRTDTDIGWYTLHIVIQWNLMFPSVNFN